MVLRSEERQAKGLRRQVGGRGVFPLLLLAVLAAVVSVGGCATGGARQKVLALVDGEQITEKDLEYSLSISHRRENLASAGRLQISQYVQRLINDTLIVQEARRMGLDGRPEIRKAVDDFILRESVVRLHNEEILGKVSVTDDEVADYYRRNYERFTLGVIRGETEDAAKELLKQIREGGDFAGLARLHSTHPSRNDGGEMVLTSRQLVPELREQVLAMKPGEVGDVLSLADGFYVIKFIERSAAPEEDFGRVRNSVEKTIRDEKEKKRAAEYLGDLRRRANIRIDEALLADVPDGGGDGEEREKWLKDVRTVAEVNGKAFTAGELVARLNPHSGQKKEGVLNGWIDFKLVDTESLRRRYDLQDDLREMVARYEDQLLRNRYIGEAIVPKIKVSDEELRDCYVKNQKSFLKPMFYRVQHITVKSRQEAEEVIESLKKGSDFSWLAKRKSMDSAAEDGGDLGWRMIGRLPEHLREAVESMKPGDVSPVIETDPFFVVVRLQAKSEEEYEEFDKVKDLVHRKCFGEKVEELYASFAAQLRNEAEVKVNEEAIRSLEEKLQR